MQNSVLESQSQAISSTSSPIYHRNEKGLQSLAEEKTLVVPRRGEVQGVK